jgi:hypothetical protein
MINFRGADFSYQDLAGRNFADGILLHADLRGAKLAGAIWTGARLAGVRWGHSAANGAIFTGADLSDAATAELRLRVAGWTVRVHRQGWVRVGRCQIRNADEWAAMGHELIAELTPAPDAPTAFVRERDWVLSASFAMQGVTP